MRMCLAPPLVAALCSGKMSTKDPSSAVYAAASKDGTLPPSPDGADDNNHKHKDDEKFKISLWLLPPDDTTSEGAEKCGSDASSASSSIRSQLRANINEIAELKELPPFEPHVTIFGGIVCSCPTEEKADQWANELLNELRKNLPSVGGIPCKFGKEKGRRPKCVLEDESDGLVIHGETYRSDMQAVQHQNIEVKWNQSCVSIMDECDQFGEAVELAYDAICEVNKRLGGHAVPANFFVKDGTAFDWRTTLKPPLSKPHYSHAYGNDHSLIAERRNDGGPLIDAPPDFISHEAMLIWTWPADLDGVKNNKWKEVGGEGKGRVPLISPSTI